MQFWRQCCHVDVYKRQSDYYARLYVLFGKDTAANKQVADVKGDVSALEDQIAESPHTVALYTMVTSDHYRVIVITSGATVAREFAIVDTELNKKVADFEQALRDPRRDPRPVSYTHLDVYKRQVLDLGACAAREKRL